MANRQAPDQRLGLRDKPYHMTGELDKEAYFNRLDPEDRLNLEVVLQRSREVASLMETELDVLAVGSSADLLSGYGDLDLLYCPKKVTVRLEFVRQVHDRLVGDSRFLVQRQYPGGSAPIFHDPHTPYKLFAFPVSAREAKVIDMTFVSEYGGSVTDIISFHRQNNLAFSRLTE